MAMTVRRTRGGRLHIVNEPDANGFEVSTRRRLVEWAFAAVSACLAQLATSSTTRQPPLPSVPLNPISPGDGCDDGNVHLLNEVRCSTAARPHFSGGNRSRPQRSVVIAERTSFDLSGTVRL